MLYDCRRTPQFEPATANSFLRSPLHTPTSTTTRLQLRRLRSGSRYCCSLAMPFVADFGQPSRRCARCMLWTKQVARVHRRVDTHRCCCCRGVCEDGVGRRPRHSTPQIPICETRRRFCVVSNVFTAVSCRKCCCPRTRTRTRHKLPTAERKFLQHSEPLLYVCEKTNG